MTAALTCAHVAAHKKLEKTQVLRLECEERLEGLYEKFGFVATNKDAYGYTLMRRNHANPSDKPKPDPTVVLYAGPGTGYVEIRNPITARNKSKPAPDAAVNVGDGSGPLAHVMIPNPITEGNLSRSRL